MALTGMQIYKNLPKTNCKDCGLPTCMAFAMQVAAKQRALTDCPHITEEAKAAMSEASAPPMRLIKIGPEGSSFDIGQETVLFRHEEKFHRPAGIAVRVPASLSDAEVAARLEAIGKSSFTRVGKTLKVALAAVEVEGAGAAARAKLAAEKSPVPLVLIGKPDALKSAAEAINTRWPGRNRSMAVAPATDVVKSPLNREKSMEKLVSGISGGTSAATFRNSWLSVITRAGGRCRRARASDNSRSFTTIA